jgi:putative secretion ATPase (PEP-CTERM system associated)
MYEKHFSFKCKPFELVPNPDFLFLSSTHKKAITYLDYGIKEKIGFILLTGEIGSGKTTIMRNLIKGLNGSVKLSRVNNTKVSSEQLISMINEDFGLDIEGKNKIRLLSELNEFLVDQYAKGLHPVLLIDEAQNLSAELLEEVRLLSNLETDKAKLMQIILVGQPELKRILMLPELLQLRQRINVNYHITPLSIDETAGYIQHRLNVAGNQKAIRLEDDLLYIIYQFSRGIPRLINILCDFSLLTAYVEGKIEVTADLIKEVVEDLESNDYWNGAKYSPESGKNTGEAESSELQDAKDLALRIVKLENMLSQIIEVGSPALAPLAEKINQLEDNMSMFADDHKVSKVSEYFEQMEEKLACRILLRIAEENNLPEMLERLDRLEKNIRPDSQEKAQTDEKEHEGNAE